MKNKKTIVAINGSASKASSNLAVINEIMSQSKNNFDFIIFNGLKDLPHFDTSLTDQKTPIAVVRFRELIEKADGLIICTPEYVFSIPSGLKNAIEWCVSTTVFSKKKLGIITASASGIKGHEELQLIMKTLECSIVKNTTLLIQGIRGKVDKEGVFSQEVKEELRNFTNSYLKFIKDEL
jgi:NAD(P)H-dependent FMN reductase